MLRTLKRSCIILTMKEINIPNKLISLDNVAVYNSKERIRINGYVWAGRERRDSHFIFNIILEQVIRKHFWFEGLTLSFITSQD